MRFTSQTTSNGVSERLFTLDDIPGVLWSPADAVGTCPLVLLGHGGGQHKKALGMVARAHRYVTSCGFAVAAIDAPGHGDRPRTPPHAPRHCAPRRSAPHRPPAHRPWKAPYHMPARTRETATRGRSRPSIPLIARIPPARPMPPESARPHGATPRAGGPAPTTKQQCPPNHSSGRLRRGLFQRQVYAGSEFCHLPSMRRIWLLARHTAETFL